MRPLTFFIGTLALLLFIVFEFFSKAFPHVEFLKFAGAAISIALLTGYFVYNYENVKIAFKRRGAKFGMSSGVVLILGLLIIIGCVFLSTKASFNKSWDVTRNAENTLASQSLNAIQNIQDQNVKVTITAFFENEDVKANFNSLIRLYQNVWPDLSVEFIDPVKERTIAESEGLTSPNTVIFKSGDQKFRITTFNEEKVTTALVNVIKQKSRKIYFTTGHGEGTISNQEAKGYNQAVKLLEQNKYTVEPLNILEKGEVPSDADLLIVGGPKYDISAEEIGSIEKYFLSGGAVLVLNDSVNEVEGLNRFIGKYGVKFNYDYLVLRPDDPRASMLGQNIALVTDFDTVHPVTREFSKENIVAVPLANSRSLEVETEPKENYKIDVLAKTSPIILRVKNVTKKEDLKNIGQNRLEEGEFNVIAVSQTTAKEGEEKNSRLAVVGSAQLASNFGAQTSQNLDLFMNIVHYLTRDDNYISIRPKDEMKSTLSLESNVSQVTLQLITYFYPFVFLFSGIFLWLRRRKS